MLEFLQYPFMLRALAAGLMVAILLGWLGTFAVVRQLSFIGEGIAHSSLTGIALALLLGWAPMPVTIILSIIIAIFIYFLEKRSNLSGDMAIAVVFTSFLAVGIILLSFYQGYQPELISFLFGNILMINQFDLINILLIGLVMISGLIIFYRQLLFTTFDPIGAQLAGLRLWLYDCLLYVALALAIVLSIKLVGIVLVSALLVTPSAIAKSFSTSFKNFTSLAIAISCLTVTVGLILSYYLDLPSGATIILTGSCLLILSLIWQKIKKSFKLA